MEINLEKLDEIVLEPGVKGDYRLFNQDHELLVSMKIDCRRDLVIKLFKAYRNNVED